MARLGRSGQACKSMLDADQIQGVTRSNTVGSGVKCKRRRKGQAVGNPKCCGSMLALSDLAQT